MAYNPGVTDRSGELMAQGIGQLGQSLAGGIEKYAQNKMLTTQQIAKWEGAVQADSSILSSAPAGIGKIIEKLHSGGGVGLKDAALLGAYADSFTTQRKEKQARDASLKAQEMAVAKWEQEQEKFGLEKRAIEEERALAERLRTVGGQGGDASTLVRGALRAGASLQTAGSLASSMASLTNASAKSVPVKMTREQLDSLTKGGMDFDAAPNEDGTYSVSKVSAFKPGQQINVNNQLGDSLREQRFKDLSKRRDTEVLKMLESKPQIEAMSNLLSATGDKEIVAGSLANLELGTKQFINKAAGKDVFKDVSSTEQYLANSVVQTGNIITLFGSGTGLSDSDKVLAEKAAGGNLTVTRETLRELNRIAKEVFTKKLTMFNQDVTQTFGGDEKDDAFAKRSLFVPEEFGKFAPSLAEQAAAEKNRRSKL